MSFKILWVLTGCHGKQASLNSKHKTDQHHKREGPACAAYGGFATSNLKGGQASWDFESSCFPFSSFILDTSIKGKKIIVSKPEDQNRGLNTMGQGYWW